MGTGRGAAMVAAGGHIDWWCPNRFDATPMLWSLLDADGAEARWADSEIVSWDATPAGPTAHTELRIGGRRLSVWDGLVAHAGSTALIRLVRSQGSALTVTHCLTAGGFDAPRELFDNAEAPTSDRLRVVGGDAHRIDGWSVETDVVARPDRWTGFAIVVEPAAELALGAVDLERLLVDAEQANQRVRRRVRLPHHHPTRVVDALHVLHALTDPDSGAPVASPTTSLPEAVGGTRQFDYRYSWLRDSGNAVATAALLGHPHAAHRYIDNVTALLRQHGEHLRPVTTTVGDPVPDERQIGGVSGWGGSQPVRIGNGANDQRQMDSVTCVLEAIDVHVSCGGRMSADTWSTVQQLAEMLVRTPSAPSNGVWELREARLLVSEELSRWVGLDRAIHVGRRRRPWRRHPSWLVARAAARARVEAALDPETGLLPQAFGGDPMFTDASSLLVAINGFWRRDDPRLRRLVYGTVGRLEQGSFLRRYPPMDDGFSGVEGCFVPASWWAVSALAAIGDLHEAEHRADEMCLQLPPLQPEEWDVAEDRPLGNTPLLWSHTEAARALYNLHVERIRHRFGSIGVGMWHIGRYLRVRLRVHRP